MEKHDLRLEVAALVIFVTILLIWAIYWVAPSLDDLEGRISVLEGTPVAEERP